MYSQERAEVQEGLDTLCPYLAAFVQQARASSGSRHRGDGSSHSKRTDIYALLKTIRDEWDAVFRSRLPSAVRSYVHELLDIRNRWAHQEPFSMNDSERALDTIRQMARAIGADHLAATGGHARPSGLRATRKMAIDRKRAPTQRDVMRSLYAKWGNNPERLVAEYAAAERRGEVARKRNESGVSPEAYARALLADAWNKGWLAN